MRSNAVVGIVGCAFLFALSVTIAAQNDQGNGNSGGDDESRIQRGFDYARQQHITLDLRHKNRALVGLGSYLVNAVGGCNDCHTAPPFTLDPMEGLGAPKQINNACYLAGGTPFGDPADPATPVSRDITPWEDGKPAGLSRDAFIHVIRTGEDPDNPGQVLHVMPWPVYQAMTNRDLRAIYEYLSSIPPILVNTCGVPSE